MESTPVKESYAEDLEWARLRMLVAKERVSLAEKLRHQGPPSAQQLEQAQAELRRATLCLRAQAAQAFRANANPLFWHDRFGRPRDMAEREYQQSA
jgi:hypothetical protein